MNKTKNIYIKYRREEKAYELYDEETERSYWIKKDKKGKLNLIKIREWDI